mgnify:CR=1 FL=1
MFFKCNLIGKNKFLYNEKEAFIDNALVGLAWIKNRVILSCNRKLEEMLGYAHGEADGLPTHAFYESLPPNYFCSRCE